MTIVVIASVFYFAQNDKVIVMQNETKDLKVGKVAPESPVEIEIVSKKSEKSQEIVQNTKIKIAQIEEIKVDISNWKTYTSKKYGFSVKYPEEWEAQISSEVGDVAILLAKNSINYIKFYPNGGGVSASERPYLPKKYNIKINNLVAFVSEWEPKSGQSNFEYKYIHNDTVAVFNFDTGIWNNDAYIKTMYDDESKSVVYEILNTVEFIE